MTRPISDAHAVCSECERAELLDASLLDRAALPEAWPVCCGLPMELPALDEVDRINQARREEPCGGAA